MFVSRDGMKVYYEVHGQKSPLVMLHGMGKDHTVWDRFIDFLSDHYQLILIDLLGSGQTECSSDTFSMEDMARGVELVIDEIGERAVDVLGHSMGGFVAQQLALNSPEKVQRMALISSTACQGPISRFSMDTVAEMRKGGVSLEYVVRSFIPLAFSNGFLAREGMLQKVVEDMMDEEHPQSLENYLRQAGAMSGHDTRERLHEINHPTLIMTGSADVLAPPMDSHTLRSGIKNSSIEILEGVGHVLQMEAPEAFVGALLAHFKALD